MGSRNGVRSYRQRSEATKAELVGVAARLFGDRGYDATSLDEVVASCNVTKGALYHHFAGKRQLFEAAFEHEQRKLSVALTRAFAGRRDPWQAVVKGCTGFLEIALDPAARRIVVLDGPDVLGWRRAREIEGWYWHVTLRDALERAAADPSIAGHDLEVLARMIHALCGEAVLYVASAADPPAAKRRAERELRSVLTGVARADGPSGVARRDRAGA